MSIPSYDKFIEPVLRYLATHCDGAIARDVQFAAASALGLTDSEKAELLPSGLEPVYKNRAGWAHDRLKRAGLSSSLRHGFWKITTEGLKFASDYPVSIPVEKLKDICSVNLDKRIRQTSAVVSGSEFESNQPVDIASPDDRLASAISDLRRKVGSELLDILSTVSPHSFENIVLDLLHSMGYGASREDLQRVGGVSDAGIDGIISLDRLGLEKVYVQAKKWQGTVGRPDVQAFYGALEGQRAAKGVFITTSSFSSQAREYAKSVGRIVLVDGERLAELMMDYEVGVTSRSQKIPKLDSDYFDQ